MPEDRIAPREYYSIGEVCELTGLKPHVLRYWETQFRDLSPAKNRAGNRVYRPREIKIIQLVKHLLYEEKYTIDGARRKLEELRGSGKLYESSDRILDRQTIRELRREVKALLDLLDLPESGDSGPERAPAS
jgi:DNA-binding transcriptional MerR regulator